MRNFVNVLAVALLLPLCVWAETDANLTGHVLDQLTGEHMPYVTVQVKGTAIGGVTDESGHYYLHNLPLGKQVVVFSCVGYETAEREIVAYASTLTEANVSLREVSAELADVTVTADRYESKRKESSSIINVLSPLVFEATTAHCMADVLDYQPGLRVETSCANCGQTQLRMNGLGGQYSQILMDSRPIFSSLASVYGLEQVPAGMVEKVEVVRGGGSAVFGANAIAGVVNIVTKEPVRNFINVNHTSSFLEKGAYDINTAMNASVVSENRKAGLFLFAIQRNRKQYDRDGDGFSDIPKLNSTTAGMRSYFKTSAYSKITVEYHHVTDFRRGGCDIDQPPHETDLAEQLRHNIDAGALKFDWATADNRHALSVYTNAQYIGRDSYFGTDKNPDAYGRSTDLTALAGGQYRFGYTCGNVPTELHAGVEYSYNDLHDKILGYGRDMRQQVHVYGGYAQNEWKTDKWAVAVGLRLDKHSLLKSPVCSPRVNVRYTPLKEIILRVTYARGYRAPQTYEEDLHVNAVGGEVSLITLAPGLKPEYSNSLTASADLYKTWGDWDTNLTLEGFFTQLDNVFTLVENGHDDAGNLLLTRTNASGARVAGLNVEAGVTFRNLLSLQCGYTFQRSLYIDPFKWSEDESLTPQRRMFRTPDNYGYFLVNVMPVHDLTISLNGKLTGSMLVQHYAGYVEKDEETLTKAFVDLGVKVAYDIHLYKQYTLEVNCGIKNLLDQYQSDLDKGMERDGGYVYGPSLPRTYFVGLNLKI